MALTYTIFQSEDEGSGATILFSDGTIQQLSQGNANFGRVVQTLTTTPIDEIDEEALLALIIPALSVGKNLNRLSERVSFDGANILFDGDVVNDAIAEHILRIVKEGGNPDSYKALVNFMEKLYTNPSETSRNSLYNFIVKHGITIDADGDFYAYKGVNADATSINKGFGIVDGVSMNGSLPNNPGSILEMPRTMIDDNPDRGCGVGLHAGSHAYASNWANGMVLLVKINPRDVVSVPTDCSYAKIRTCRYKVVQQIVQPTTATTYTAQVSHDLNRMGTLTKMVEQGQKVPVSFTYTRGNGQAINVEMTVREIRKNSNSESILIGEDSDGETRSYRGTYVTDLVISQNALAKHVGINTAKVATPAPSKATGDFGALREGLEAGDIVLCDFNYVTVDGEARSLEDFEAYSIRSAGWRGHELLVGEREDGETRSYRLDRITDLVVKNEDADDDGEVVQVPAWARPAINAAVVTPKADTADDVKKLVEQGATVIVSFNYTTVDGEARTLKNFEATDVRAGGWRGNDLLVGVRDEDGEVRTYRLDRITDVEIHEVFDK